MTGNANVRGSVARTRLQIELPMMLRANQVAIFHSTARKVRPSVRTSVFQAVDTVRAADSHKCQFVTSQLHEDRLIGPALVERHRKNKTGFVTPGVTHSFSRRARPQI